MTTGHRNADLGPIRTGGWHATCRADLCGWATPISPARTKAAVIAKARGHAFRYQHAVTLQALTLQVLTPFSLPDPERT